jgi:hypothetical protein
MSKKSKGKVVGQQELDGKTFVRIVLENGLRHIIPKERYDAAESRARKMKGMAEILMRAYRDYLHARDRTDVEYVFNVSTEEFAVDIIERNNRTDEGGLARIIGRSKNLVKEGVPPIFRKEFETGNKHTDEEGHEYYSYPSVDSVINMFARADPEIRHFGAYANHAHTESIQHFRDFAVREEIFDQVKTELEWRVEESFKYRFESERTKDYVFECVRNAADHLAKELPRMEKSDKSRLKTYEKGKDEVFSIVRTPFWFTRYMQTSIKAILTEYWAAFVSDFHSAEQKTVDSFVNANSQYPTARLNSKLFPKLSPDFDELDAGKEELYYSLEAENLIVRVQEMLRSGIFDELTEKMFASMDQEHHDALAELLGRFVREKATSTLDYATPVRELCVTWGLPRFEGFGGFVNTVIEKQHIAALRAANDEEFIEYMNSSRNTQMHGKRPALRAYLAERVAGLIEPLLPESRYVSHAARKIGLDKEVARNYCKLHRQTQQDQR